MLESLSITNFYEFLGYCIIVLPLSFFVIRSLAVVYDALNTYHYLPGDFNDNCDPQESSPERLSRKVWLVGVYNAMGVGASVVLMLGLQSIGNTINTLDNSIQIAVTSDALLGVAVISVVFNSTIRLSAFSKSTFKPRDEDDQKYVRNIILGFGFSFWTTLYFILVFGFGLGIITGNAETLIEGNWSTTIIPPGKESVSQALLIIFVFPFIGALISEVFLKYLLKVPDSLKECN
jgi:hypothetical protein